MKKEGLEVEKPNVHKFKDPKDRLLKEPADTEMKDVEKTTDEDEAKKDVDLLTLEDIKEYIKLVERATASKEPRFMSRVLRGLVSLRRKLNANVLCRAIQLYFPFVSAPRNDLIEFLRLANDAAENVAVRARSARVLQPEVEIYLHLLVLLFLLDGREKKDVDVDGMDDLKREKRKEELTEQAVNCSEKLMSKICSQNRRTLDMLAAKCYFYHSRTMELAGKLDSIRGFLLGRLRTCTLRADHEGQATLINLLLRNYLQFNLYSQADKLVSKSVFPEHVSNNEWARHLYYLGRLKAIQLVYSEAHRHLLQALRKAPQHSATGFKQTVQKLAITVELLLGDIPDRAIFRQPTMRNALQPYFLLTQAVRNGDLARFNEVLSECGTKFQKDGTYTLIVRLHHNVIKTGIRKINLSYSRISLADVARKLQLDSPEDTEFILAKAIRDGVIEATIDHEHSYVQSKEISDVYGTREPMQAFHQRVSFCLDIYNQSVRAMRFPPKSYSTDLESAEERREREQQEMESAKDLADDDFDGFN